MLVSVYLSLKHAAEESPSCPHPCHQKRERGEKSGERREEIEEKRDERERKKKFYFIGFTRNLTTTVCPE